jgi:hypothetical protein
LSTGNSKTEVFDWINSFNPRVTGLAAPKGTLFRYIPTIGVPVQLLKNDDGFSTNWTAAGEGDQAAVYYVGTGDLTTIQSAIDLAFAEGSGTGGKISTILVPPGEYIENLTFRPGQCLIAQSSTVATGAVKIQGQHVYAPPVNSDPLSVLVQLQGFTLADPNAGDTITFQGPNGALFSLSGCAFIKTAAGRGCYSPNATGIFVMAACSTTQFTSSDPWVESASTVTVLNQCSHASGGVAPMLLCTSSGFAQFTQNTMFGGAPYAVSFQGGSPLIFNNNLFTFGADADCLRLGAGVTATGVFNTLSCPTGTGYVVQGTGTLNGSMLVYPDNNTKDPGLTFNLLSSDP